MDTQDFVFSADHLSTFTPQLELEELLTLTQVSKSAYTFLSQKKILEFLYTRLHAMEKSVPRLLDANNPKPIIDFNRAFKELHVRQQAEIRFLKKWHPFLKFPETAKPSLKILEVNHHLLNQYNRQLIHQTVLEQTRGVLTLTAITRFLTSEEDVYYFSQLEELRFSSSSCNRLEKLHITGFHSLKKLFCRDNQLTELTLQDLPNLTVLICNKNELTSLELHKIPTLKKLEFDYNKNISTLNFKGLSSIESISHADMIFSLPETIDLNIEGASQIIQNLFGEKEEKCLFEKFKKANDLEKKEIIRRLGKRYNIENCVKYDCVYYPTFLSTPRVLSLFLAKLQLTESPSQPESISALPDTNTIQTLYQFLASMDETLAATLETNDPEMFLKFECAFNKIRTRQQNEIAFFSQRYSHLPLPPMPDDPIRKLEQMHGFLNQINRNIIHEAVLKQPGKNLIISGITRFIIPSEDIDHFAHLEQLTFEEYTNLLKELTINGLPSLKYISCIGNKLMALVLKDLPALTEIKCFHNLLTTLHLQFFASLKRIDCQGNNQLSVVNLEGCVALESLSCANNIKLTKLKCSLSQLTILDLQGCIALETLDFGNLEDFKIKFLVLKKTSLYVQNRLRSIQENIDSKNLINSRKKGTIQQTPPATYQPFYQHLQEAAPLVVYKPVIQNQPPSENQFLPQREMLPQPHVFQSSENTHMGTSMSNN